MIQLYFLSVLFNGLAGYILLAGNRDEETHIETSLKFSPRGRTFQFVLGILCVLTGILKLLSPSMDNILILGDLAPALAGVVAGFTLIFGFYRGISGEASGSVFREHDSAETGGKWDRLGETFLRYKKVVGVLLIATAVLHFLFPQALFL